MNIIDPIASTQNITTNYTQVTDVDPILTTQNNIVSPEPVSTLVPLVLA